MKLTPYIYLILFSLFTSCVTVRDKISMITFKDYGEYFDNVNGKKFKVGNTKQIVEINDVTFIVTRILISRPKDTLNFSPDYVGTDEEVRDTQYVAHAILKGKEIGMKYAKNGNNWSEGGEFNVDSLYKTEGINEENMHAFSLDIGKPAQLIKEDGITIEKYLLKKTNTSGPDSVYRYYDKRLANVKFSLSKSLDAKHDSKLVKVQFVFLQKKINDRMHPRLVHEASMQIDSRADKACFYRLLDMFRSGYLKFKE